MTVRFFLYLLLLIYLLIVGLIRFNKLMRPFQILVIVVGCTLVSEFISRIFVQEFRNSSPVYHFLNVVNFTGYALIYYFLLQSRLSKKIILFLIGIATCFAIFNTLFMQGLWMFPSNFLLILCLANVYFSLLFFRQLLNDTSNGSLLVQSVFWFNCAVIFFFTIIFLYWGVYNHLVRKKFDTKTISAIMYYLNIVYYLLIGFCIHTNKKMAAAV